MLWAVKLVRYVQLKKFDEKRRHYDCKDLNKEGDDKVMVDVA